MDKAYIRTKCDRILLDKQSAFGKILNDRIQQVYKHHVNALGTQINYEFLTDFTSELLSAYTGVISEVMVGLIQEVLSDDSFDDLD